MEKVKIKLKDLEVGNSRLFKKNSWEDENATKNLNSYTEERWRSLCIFTEKDENV